MGSVSPQLDGRINEGSKWPTWLEKTETRAMLVPLTPDSEMHPQAANSMYWECAHEVDDPRFEKEAWISSTLLSFGPCGFSVRSDATVIFCAAADAPGISKMPTGPVGSDAAIITSLFVTSQRAGRGLEAVLLDTAIMDLMERDFEAVEAFGYHDVGENGDDEIYYDSSDDSGFDDLFNSASKGFFADVNYEIARHFLGTRPDNIGLIPVSVLQAAGFEVIKDHPVTPRLRLELPPAHDLLSAAAVEDLVAKALA